MKKIKKDDTVLVTKGRSRGETGRVMRILANDRAIVEGLCLVTHYVKPNPEQQVQGGMVKKEASIHISNLALVNPQTQKADRVGIRILEDGTKVRFLKSNKEVV